VESLQPKVRRLLVSVIYQRPLSSLCPPQNMQLLPEQNGLVRLRVNSSSPNLRELHRKQRDTDKITKLDKRLMTTTGTTAFTPDFNEIIEEAFERCGVELRTGYHYRTARRSSNLLTIEWANRGINLWTLEEGSIPLVTGQAEYDLPVNTIDLFRACHPNGNRSEPTRPHHYPDQHFNLRHHP
jgi:hypothetical protein